MGWDGWINKHIYSGETLAPRGIPRERERKNRVESPNTTKEEKKRTTEGKDTMLHFLYGACHRLLHCSWFLLDASAKEKGREAGTCQDIVIES